MRSLALLAILIAIPAPRPVSAQHTERPGASSRAQAIEARRDFADTAVGTYSGDVMSDARGSSRSDVRIFVTKIGPNRIRVSSDYSRLPTFETSLIRAMETIQNRDGYEVFLLDMSRQPRSLHVTVDDAAWAGTRE